MVDRGLIPGSRFVAILAAVTQAAGMRILLRMAGCAVSRCRLQDLECACVTVALVAGERSVSAFQCERGSLMIEGTALKAVDAVVTAQAARAECLDMVDHIA